MCQNWDGYGSIPGPVLACVQGISINGYSIDFWLLFINATKLLTKYQLIMKYFKVQTLSGYYKPHDNITDSV